MTQLYRVAKKGPIALFGRKNMFFKPHFLGDVVRILEELLNKSHWRAHRDGPGRSTNFYGINFGHLRRCNKLLSYCLYYRNLRNRVILWTI